MGCKSSTPIKNDAVLPKAAPVAKASAPAAVAIVEAVTIKNTTIAEPVTQTTDNVAPMTTNVAAEQFVAAISAVSDLSKEDSMIMEATPAKPEPVKEEVVEAPVAMVAAPAAPVQPTPTSAPVDKENATKAKASTPSKTFGVASSHQQHQSPMRSALSAKTVFTANVVTSPFGKSIAVAPVCNSPMPTTAAPTPVVAASKKNVTFGRMSATKAQQKTHKMNVAAGKPKKSKKADANVDSSKVFAMTMAFERLLTNVHTLETQLSH